MGMNLRILLRAACLLATPVLLAQGPLNPPGPPGPAMKSLDQIYNRVEAKGDQRIPISSAPFTINSPGSYYLTGNLSVSGSDGIRVFADDVTIDLNGYCLSSGSSSISIGVFSSRARICVRNGSLVGWPGSAVELGSQCAVEGVNIDGPVGARLGSGGRVSRCRIQVNNAGIAGIAAVAVGPNSTVDDCSVVLVEGTALIYGIYADYNSRIRGCTVIGTSRTKHQGIALSTGTVTDCSVVGCVVAVLTMFSDQPVVIDHVNAVDCTTGISVQANAVVTHCSLLGDTGTPVANGVGVKVSGGGAILQGVTVEGFERGIFVDALISDRRTARLTDCTVTRCTLAGIETRMANVSGCSVTRCGTNGMSLGNSSTVVSCTATDNTQIGISVGNGSSVSGCTVTNNMNTGISVGDGSSVSGCTVRQNATGIGVGGGAMVTGNTCDQNSLAGIYIGATSCRIEGNQLLFNGKGVNFGGAGNTVFKNTLRGNSSNFFGSSGNDIAPTQSAATMTNPAANITF
jgi:parallel beta-helix repeat protein